jgi:hypothetical protein
MNSAKTSRTEYSRSSDPFANIRVMRRCDAMVPGRRAGKYDGLRPCLACVSRGEIGVFATGFGMSTSGFSRKLGKSLLTTFSVAILLCGCSTNDNKHKVSDDVSALRKVVDIPVSLKSAQWEIFGTPEYTGGVPGPTDYLTLIAEIEPAEKSMNFPVSADHNSMYIVPEAARTWISGEFRPILEKHKNSALDLSTVKECHPYAARLKQSGNPVNGFACAGSGKVFVYLSLL